MFIVNVTFWRLHYLQNTRFRNILANSEKAAFVPQNTECLCLLQYGKDVKFQQKDISEW